ncbi:DUF4097 family beta strand repeat-containing protein [Jeotgalibacillus marinus]|uniref:DUF4097 family beta strand repeat-containing protein n=1 Tax=Jeotgalibacillus marinus TaxID=86667 RepID=A0ABV3Q6X3_9BACL
MKRRILGVVLIFLGIAAVYGIGKPFYKSIFATVEINEEKIIEAAYIEVVNIRTSSTNVKVVPATTNQITVYVDGIIVKKLEDTYHLKVKEADGQLNIEYLSNENIIGIKLESKKDINVRVTLPEKVYRELLITTSSGNIEVENVVADTFESKTTSGDQTIKDIKTNDDVLIHSTSGNIALKRNTMTAFTINTTSGDVETEALDSQRGQINTTSGSVTMNIKQMIKELDIATTSGDVKTDFENNPESLRIDFKGKSGKPDIQLKDIMYEYKDENSAIGVIGKGVHILKVRTSSGDLKVR